MGAILGTGSIVFISLTLGKLVPDSIYTSIVLNGIYVFIYYLTIFGLPMLWIKIIDKIINR